MGEFIEVSKIAELKDGTMKVVLAQGREIVLAKVRDRYYAAGKRCPDLGGKLSQGKLEGAVVTCPKHGSQFDLRDGHVVRWLKGSGLIAMIGKTLKSPRPLTIYNVKVADDKVWLET